MKKTLTMILLLVMGCSSPESPAMDSACLQALSQEAIEISCSQSSTRIKFYSSSDWTARSSEEWVSLSETEGNGGEMSIKLIVAENPTTAARDATIQLNSGQATLTYTVTQSGRAIKVSIIGDSISTFAGWIPDGYSAHYPTSDNVLTKVEQTYWWILINEKMPNAEFEFNNSYSGTLVTKHDSRAGKDFCARYLAKGLGNPDLVLIHGGRNDVAQTDNYDKGQNAPCIRIAPGSDLKVNSKTLPTDELLAPVFAAAATAAKNGTIEQLPDETFAEAYVKLVNLMMKKNPELKIICIVGDMTYPSEEVCIQKIASHYGLRCTDLLAVNGWNGCTTDPNYNPMPKQAGSHPNPVGMKFIAEKIWAEHHDYIEN